MNLSYINKSIYCVLRSYRDVKSLSLTAIDDYPNNYGVKVSMTTRIKISKLIVNLCKKILDKDKTFINFLPRFLKQSKLHLYQLKKLNCDTANDKELFFSTYQLLISIAFDKRHSGFFTTDNTDIYC
tara:strand:- start:92 stop:472 length:381 start_codon:yes stop_codon:yes gene_type:complete